MSKKVLLMEQIYIGILSLILIYLHKSHSYEAIRQQMVQFKSINLNGVC